MKINRRFSPIDREITQQQFLFESLKDRLGEASSIEVDTILAVRVASALRNREVIDHEPELTTETIDRLRTKLSAAKRSGSIDR
jgi:Mg-chelatase subunit ChlI